MPSKHSLKIKPAFSSACLMKMYDVNHSPKRCVLCCVSCFGSWKPQHSSTQPCSQKGESLLATRWASSDFVFIFLSGNAHLKGIGPPKFSAAAVCTIFFFKSTQEGCLGGHGECFSQTEVHVSDTLNSSQPSDYHRMLTMSGNLLTVCSTPLPRLCYNSKRLPREIFSSAF